MDKNDLISRSATLHAMKMDPAPPFRVVMEMPAIDPKKLRPKGKWKKSIGISLFGHDSTPVFKCSKCGAEFCDVLNSLTLKYHYCPNCGAMMMEG